MRLTTKGRFAVTAMIDVAMHAHAGPVSLAEIAQRQRISLSYLEQLFGKLRKRGIVESVRGPGGGYLPAEALEDLSVASIIRAVDEPIDATQCAGKQDCHDHGPCLTHSLWAELNNQISTYLNSVSLATLAAQARSASPSSAPVVLRDFRAMPRSRALSAAHPSL